MRKSYIALVGILVLSFILAACGGAATTAAPTSAPQTTEAPTTAPAAAPTTGPSSAGGGTIALLLPETKTTRYETADRPDFEAKFKELCHS